jgi:hypothetical protein
MNTVFDRRHAERFAEMLDETDGARRRPNTDVEAQLMELVTLGDKLGGVRVPGPAAGFQTELRAQLLATAEREGIGITAAEPEPVVVASCRPKRTRLAIVAGAVGALTLTGVLLIASGSAKPGDGLYPLKRSTERAQLALAGSDQSRAKLYLDFARTRLGEAHAVRTDAQGFGGALVAMDTNTADGARLLTISAVTQKDPATLDALDRFVADQRFRIVQLTGLVGAASQVKVDTSLALLDAIAARSQLLRTALACGVGTMGLSDALGPLPQSCPVRMAFTSR